MSTSRTKLHAVQQTVPATPPDESAWSFAALLRVFAASLLTWMRKFRVRPADAEDATQKALVEAWQRVSSVPATHDEARREMLRIAVKIARRWRRRAARLVCVDALELTDPRDAEAWVAARMLWFEALYRLDEPTRSLIITRHIDERTYKDIGAEMGKEEETARQRVNVAEKKMQAEIDKLLGKDKKRNGSSAAMGFGFALDPFDRAVFRAILDVEEEFDIDTAPVSSVRPKARTNSWPWQYVSMGLIAVALFLVPGQGSRTEALYASKMGNIPLPRVEVRAAVQTTDVASLPLPPSLPRKTMAPVPHAAPGATTASSCIGTFLFACESHSKV